MIDIIVLLSVKSETFKQSSELYRKAIDLPTIQEGVSLGIILW